LLVYKYLTEILVNFWKSLSENWQIAIFTVGGTIVGTIFGVILQSKLVKHNKKEN
jgi:hypothetical protein